MHTNNNMAALAPQLRARAAALALLGIATGAFQWQCQAAPLQAGTPNEFMARGPAGLFALRCVDKATGRGVPRVSLLGVDNSVWLTDSAGYAAIDVTSGICKKNTLSLTPPAHANKSCLSAPHADLPVTRLTRVKWWGAVRR